MTQVPRVVETVDLGARARWAVVQSPYKDLTWRALADAQVDPALGSVSVAIGSSPLEALAVLAVVRTRWPWVPGCLVLTATDSRTEDCARLIVPDPGALAYVAIGANRPLLAQNVARAVAARPSPTPHQMATFVCLRLGQASLFDPLLDQFSAEVNSAGCPRSTATYSRRFARHGPFTARDWRRISWLSHLLGSMGHRSDGPGSLDPLGERSLLAARLSERYLRVSSRTFWETIGWEWVLEGALRVAGYVPKSVSPRP